MLLKPPKISRIKEGKATKPSKKGENVAEASENKQK